jgi:hypothetical protein
MKLKRAVVFVLVLIWSLAALASRAQDAAPESNALLIYNRESATIINTAQENISIQKVSFWRAGGKVNLNAQQVGEILGPGQCVQIWRDNPPARPPKPDECNKRLRWIVTRNRALHFWLPQLENDSFRAGVNGRAVAICSIGAGRCAFNIPQGDADQKSWDVLDATTNKPMPAGIQVAYDANQMWIGNFTEGTTLPTNNLRLFYKVKGQEITWAPIDGPWDSGPWDDRGLAAGECIVLYRDPAAITPLLPCTAVGQSLREDQPWLLNFEISGPREDRRATCGDTKPPTGPTLCLAGG